MKKVVNVGIGGRGFTMDEDAYNRLNSYLEKFRAKAGMGIQTREVMDDLESRIAELFGERLNSFRDVVDIETVNRVISQLGMPDGQPFTENECGGAEFCYGEPVRPVKKFFRNPDNKVLGGVCSGLAGYLDVDAVLIRVIFIVAFFLGSAGFWIYLILWIIAPLAVTPVQKCEMYGLPVTAENLSRFSTSK